MRPFACGVLAVVLIALETLMAQAPGDRPVGNPRATRSVVAGTRGMVATSQPLATAAGLNVLQQGGNAVDAALAAVAVLSVVEPHMTGIGGDLFAMVYDSRSKQLRALDASGRSGRASTPEALAARGVTQLTGIHTITVPGAVSGWKALSSSYGTMPLTRLVAPAVDYARNGFPVSEIIGGEWHRSHQKLDADPLSAAVFLPGGRAPRPGEIFTNPKLAATLETIARDPDAFYGGAIGATIAAEIAKRGGLIDARDFADHTAEWVNPISTSYRGFDVYEMPPSTQGFVTLEMLNILEGFDLKSMGHNSAEVLHLITEAKRIAFADRAAYLADRTAVPPTVLGTLISKDYAAMRRKEIDRKRAAANYSPAIIPGVPTTARALADRQLAGLDRGDTVYLTVADRHGNVVSLIQSLFSDFGSGVVGGDTGVMLHNRGAGFTLAAGHPNRIAPRKRPLHTLVPAFVMKDERPWLSFGVMGGDHQAQGHVQVLVNLIDFGMNVQEAGEAARIHHGPGGVQVESAVSADARAGLQARGHTVTERRGGYGGYQGIRIDTASGVLSGGSDNRKDGAALGY
jgi:gamma-glutamyltranspeptidase/glutathione hydrolase